MQGKREECVDWGTVDTQDFTGLMSMRDISGFISEKERM